MHNPSQRDDAGAGRRPPDELTRRLAARGNGNVGVIDVRHARQRYDSALGLAAGHLVVLRLLNARYGTANTGAAGSGDPLPIVSGRLARVGAAAPPHTPEGDAGPPEDGPPNSGGGPAPDTRRQPARGAALENASRVAKERPNPPRPTDTAPPPPLIRRAAVSDVSAPAANEHGHQPSAAADTLQSPGSGAQSQHEAVERDTPAADARRPSAEPAPSTASAGDALRSPEVARLVEAKPETGGRTSLLLRQRRSETGGGLEQLSSGPREVAPQSPKPPDAIRRAEAKSETPPLLNEFTPESEGQRRHTGSSTHVPEPGLSFSPEQPPPPAPPTPSPLPLGKESVADSRLPTASGQHAPERIYRRTLERTPEAAGGTAPVGASVETRPGRADADSAVAQAASAPATASAAAAAEQPPTRLSSPETLHGTLSLAPARMVWRRGLSTRPATVSHTTYSSYPPYSAQPGVTQSPLPVVAGSPTTLYRHEAAASFPPQDAGTVPPVAPAHRGATAIDLEQITEHVSRVILRRLAVERERRGGGRWL